MPLKNIPLTGLDHFFLALEVHNGKSTTVGNTCRYFFELDGYLGYDELAKTVANHALSNQLSAARLNKRSIISGSSWKFSQAVPIRIVELNAEEKIPQEVLEYNIQLADDEPYFSFFLIQLSSGNTTFVFCWHHLLMDGYGSVLYLSSLNQQMDSYFSKPANEKHIFSEARAAKRFVRKTAEPELTSVYQGTPVVNTTPALSIVEFTQDETAIIAKNAVESGAVFGQSTFYLAACGVAVKSILEDRGTNVNSFWVPVPQDRRKKNAKGPVLSNHLSLLFFRLSEQVLNEGLAATTKSLTKQMKSQIQNRIPEKYNSLMYYLKRVPSSLYYRFIKAPHGGSLSSFLFTVAPDHPTTLNTLFGRTVIDAMNIPPITFPPGLTFAFAKFNAKTRIFVLYSSDAFSNTDIEKLKLRMKELLLREGE
jgi:hypothetical protein